MEEGNPKGLLFGFDRDEDEPWDGPGLVEGGATTSPLVIKSKLGFPALADDVEVKITIHQSGLPDGAKVCVMTEPEDRLLICEAVVGQASEVVQIQAPAAAFKSTTILVVALSLCGRSPARGASITIHACTVVASGEELPLTKSIWRL